MNKSTVMTAELRRALIAIGKRIRLARKARGHTSSSLGAAMGLSQAHISRIETGQQGLRCVTLLHLAKVLNVRPIVFLMNESLARVMQERLPTDLIRGADIVFPDNAPRRRSSARRGGCTAGRCLAGGVHLAST